MVSISDAVKRYGSPVDGVLALDHVNVEIKKNEFFTLLGPSGCGKTTLLRLIAGFEQATSGSLFLDGEDIKNLAPFQRPVNTVFQNYSLFPHMTVAENIGFGLEMQNVDKVEREQRVAEMLSLVKLEEFGNRKPSQLSGGQQQRIALARALANKPKVLLLDEPLSALDLKLRKEMQIELKRLQLSTGTTFIFVTHDQEEALTMSDRIAVMSAGHILQIGTPEDIYERPNSQFVANFIGESNFINAIYKGDNQFDIASGDIIYVAQPPKIQVGEKAILAIRPEKLSITTSTAKDADKQNSIVSGLVENVVYMGTDTNYHLRLSDQQECKLRVQNHLQAISSVKQGQKLNVSIPSEAVQVLEQ